MKKIFDPFISIIIPTYNREEILCRAIQYVLAQCYTNYELLVIDQTISHKPETKDFLNRLPPHVKVITHEPPSLPGARNRGIQEARGEIIIMIDDDVIIKQDFITQHAKHYINPSVGAVTGRVDQENKYISKIPYFFKNEFLRWISADNFQNPNLGQAYRIAGGNFSIQKIYAVKAKLFDENFIGTSWGEEFDFSLRLKKLNINILYDPEARIFHLNERSGGCESRHRFDDSVIFSKPYNLAYLIEKNRLDRLIYIYLLFYIYRQVFVKKDYFSVKGFLFLPKAHLIFIKGFVNGFQKGRKRYHQMKKSN